VELCLHSSNTSSWRGAQLGEHKDNFTFYLYHYVGSFTTASRFSGSRMKETAPRYGG
jgi:hypothetical protein